MALPNPLPDNPLRWDGWRHYNSENLYDRLCLEFDPGPSGEQIEENCRILLVWWQKKLPLKNQPSNPMTQLLRVGMDEAPQFLAEARTKLLDPQIRADFDAELRRRVVEGAVTEFKKVIEFAINNQELTSDAEERLYEAGAKLGLLRDEMVRVLEAELERTGAVRREIQQVFAQPLAAAPAEARGVPGDAVSADPADRDPATEFRRVLRLSKLCLEGDDMTDDQRDALCNVGESLGLTGGQAEDLIDEYLEEVSSMPMQAPGSTANSVRAAGVAVARAAAPSTVKLAPVTARASASAKPPSAVVPPVKKESTFVGAPVVNITPMARIQERTRFPNFVSGAGQEMLLVPSGMFNMGSNARDAAPHEQPMVPTTVSCFYMSRFPITNGEYEKFDPSHRSKRAAWADESHPAIYVSSKEAIAFGEWLSARDKRKYRLPTEAEWEYAARGSDGRIYPWGDRLDAGHFANFADKRTSFTWSDQTIDDGYAETSPVGSYPRGASPFGLEDMAGNVFEWCLDFFDFYRGKVRTNPRGPTHGQKRVYRGGSWRSRAWSLRGSARAFNQPDYSSHDVGFRLICECE